MTETPERIYGEMDVCGYCVATLLISAANQARIKINANMDPQEWDKMNGYLRSFESERIVQAIIWAWNLHGFVEINAYVCKPAVTMMHGTYLCDVHLMEEYQRVTNPTTVRMAQWRH
jgi:hypothetical protein